MRSEVFDWVKSVVAECRPKAPVLEVGSRNVNGTVRPLFPRPYTGLDIQMGKGVDVVADVCTMDLAGFETVVCCETLEHVRKPWLAVPQMFAALNPGGLLIVTWCFRFEVHNHPADYFRCTPDGLYSLLEDAGFADIRLETEGEGPVGVWATARRP